MIAIAISCDPRLLIADEATTALDVTIQAEIIELLKDLRDQRNLAVLFVSHDLALIRELCDRVVVFYAGEAVETGPVEEIIDRPRHPYTQALLRVASVGDFQRRELRVIPGQPPQMGEDVVGCRFAAALPGRHRRVPVRPGRPAAAGPRAPGALRPGRRPRARRRRRGRAGRPMTAPITARPAAPATDSRAAARAGGRRRVPRPGLAREPRAVRGRPEDLAGRDRRPGRRDRVRQDHPGQDRGRPGPAEKGPGDLPRRPDLRPARGRPQARAAQRARPARLPGSAALARPGPDRRRRSSARACGSAAASTRRRSSGARPARWRRSASTRRCWAAPPARSPAASGSASRSPARSRSTPSCCSATSRSARSTPATGTTSCGCSATSATTSGCRSSSSPMTCPRWPASPTGWWCSTGAGSSKTARSRRCSPPPATPTPPC